ncbi:glycosyltransferase family 4 protein [Corynebacterium terpenotabidum]|uniref:Mannosyltransferase n=1 Tax=Corynebacterium terpenotabidum Y-11 TaxID=1200352 RepID=S4XDF7_9CORY|nr:glycosyltransferase family 4 protein [Corynebacterium terpenotabidum]AGP30559.1 mannosyltransferase [Corynebacterium terpenotabidum Y-11]
MTTRDPRYRRVLLVTNDFPPTFGGIQSYLRDYCLELERRNPGRLVVFASTQDAASAATCDAELPFPVIRWPHRLLLPGPGAAREMARIIREQDIDTVWFGSSTPFALLAGAARRAGARRIVASTHGHEVGWSMVPGGRSVLRHIGRSVDCLTYVSRYARGRFMSAFGPNVAWEPMPGGVDATVFRPDPDGRQLVRRRHGIDDRRVIVCVSRLVPRKGQDTLVAAMPGILRQIPDAHLLIVGPGDYADALQASAVALDVADRVTLTGPVDSGELVAHYCAGDVFAMPVRTEGGGFSVEGLGIVFLESQACGVPTVAGDGGGAPESVRAGDTGDVVDGTDTAAVADCLADLLNDPERAARYSRRGRDYVLHAWNWEILGAQLEAVLDGDGRRPARHSWNWRG